MSFVNKLIAIVSTLPWYERNRMFWNMLLYENQLPFILFFYNRKHLVEDVRCLVNVSYLDFCVPPEQEGQTSSHEQQEHETYNRYSGSSALSLTRFWNTHTHTHRGHIISKY